MIGSLGIVDPPVQVHFTIKFSSYEHAAEDSVDAFSKNKQELPDGTSHRHALWLARQTYWISLVVHSVLVILHFTLLGVCISHLEHRLLVPLGRMSNIVSTTLVVVSQGFVTVYTAGLVVVTQQLAFRHNLRLSQTLTALHDKSTAWTGLGSSFLTLWRQKSLAASLWGTMAVAFYLTGIAALHVSTPSLFNLQVFNNTLETNVRTVLGIPNISLSANETAANLMTQAVSLVPFLGEDVVQISTLGLNGNILYDVLPDNQGTGIAIINATTMDINCGLMPNLKSSFDVNSSLISLIAWGDSWSVRGGITVLGPNIVCIQAAVPSISPNPADRDILVMSTINFTDSSGKVGSNVQLNSSIILTPPPNSVVVSDLAVMGCTLSVNTRGQSVYAHSNTLVDSQVPKTSSKWDFWQPSTQNYTDPMLHAWGPTLGNAPPTHTAVIDACTGVDCMGYLTVVEQYAMDHLGIVPYTGSDDGTSDDVLPVTPDLKLHELENTLANLTAALYWSAGRVRPQNRSGTLEQAALSSEGQATISQQILTSRLNLNLAPLVVGLATSILLLVLSLRLSRYPGGISGAVDSAGLLQLIWLLYGQSSIQAHIGKVEEPFISNLRGAGMFPVSLGEFRSRKGPYDLVESESQEGLHIKNGNISHPGF